MQRRVTSVDDDDLLVPLPGEFKRKNQGMCNPCECIKRIMCVLGGCLCILFFIMVVLVVSSRDANRNPSYKLSSRTKSFSNIDVREDEFFLDTLRNGEIIEIEVYDSGLAEKYVCVLDSGYQALIKPVEEWHYFSIGDIPIWDSSKLSRFHNDRLGR